MKLVELLLLIKHKKKKEKDVKHMLKNISNDKRQRLFFIGTKSIISTEKLIREEVFELI